MDEQMDERATEIVLFDQGVHKYVRFNDYDLWPGFTLLAITIIDQLFRVGLLRVTVLDSSNTSTF